MRRRTGSLVHKATWSRRLRQQIASSSDLQQVELEALSIFLGILRVDVNNAAIDAVEKAIRGVGVLLSSNEEALLIDSLTEQGYQALEDLRMRS